MMMMMMMIMMTIMRLIKNDEDDNSDDIYEDELVRTFIAIIYLILVIHSFDNFPYDIVKDPCFGTFYHNAYSEILRIE